MAQSVRELFDVLVDLAPEAREHYLKEHRVDAATRREVEELLAHDSGSGPHFSRIVGTAANAVLLGEATGSRCGAFRLVNVIGSGGMGVVYLGERADGEVKQRAAVKLMHPGMGHTQRERFLREREILAELSHPNIAHLLDAGHLSDGRPYLAMEFVDGQPIDEYCAGFSRREKVEIFLKVCGAVAYLHRNLIVHRDLKPSNILVTALGEPKLLDFGIAKMLDLSGDATVTQLRMLTPDYASPEQLKGETVGNASDIYSLGAVLHSLITGKRPGEAAPEFKGDLELVVQTALRREPGERYATVSEFAEDLKACLESRPIRARRRDAAYRARKFVRRHWPVVALSGALALALAGAGGLWHRYRSTPAVPDLRPKRLTANTPELPVDAAAISPDGRRVAYSDALGIHLHDVGSGETRLLAGTGGHLLARWTQDGSAVQAWAPGEGGGLAATVIPVAGGERRPAGPWDAYRTSPDGRRRAMTPSDRRRIVIEDANGGNAFDVQPASGALVHDFQWSPDGRHVVILSSFPDASIVEMVEVAGNRRHVLVAPEKNRSVDGVAWPTADRIIVAIQEGGRGVNSQGNSNLWEVRVDAAGTPDSDGLRRLTSWTDFPIRFGSLTTDGKRLVFIRSFRQRDVYLAEFDARQPRMGAPRRLTLDLGDDYPTSWTRDSRSVIFTSDRNGPSAIFVQGIDEKAGRQLVFGPATQIIARVTHDGGSILFWGRDRANRGVMRAAVTGGPAEFLFEASLVIGLRCSAAGPCTMAERQDDAVVVSEVEPAKGLKGRQIYRDVTAEYRGPDISPDGKWLAIPTGTRIVMRSFETGAVVREIAVEGATSASRLVSLDYAPDGRGFFAGQITPTESRQLYIDLKGRATVLWRQAGGSGIWTVPSPNGKYLAMMAYTDDSNVYLLESF